MPDFKIQPIPKVGGQNEIDRWREELRNQLNNATLDSLTDITITEPIDNDDVIYWDGSQWVNGDVPTSFLDTQYLRLDTTNDPLTDALTIEGSNDVTQLTIKANATQSITSPLLVFTDSSSAELFRLHSNGSNNIFFSATDNLTSGTDNLGIGSETLRDLTTGIQNVAIGTNALTNIESGNSNVALGRSAGQQLTTGISNLLIGQNAGTNLTTQGFNVFVGDTAGANASSFSSSNIAIGQRAGLGLTNSANVFIGTNSGSALTNVQSNVGIGHRSLAGASPGTAVGNVAIGRETGEGITTGDYNVLIGYKAGEGFTTESNKLIIENSSDITTPLIYGEFDNDFVRINGQFEVDGLADEVQTKIIGHTTQTADIFQVNDSSSNPYLVVDSSGDVGIQTAAPTQALDVTGRMTVGPSGTTKDNAYFGSLAITKPASGTAQYINLTRSLQYVWSIGMVAGTNTFGIGPGSLTDTSFSPVFKIESLTGNISYTAGLILGGVSTKTGNYTLTSTDRSIEIDASSSTVTITTQSSPTQWQVFHVSCSDSTNTAKISFAGGSFYGETELPLVKGEDVSFMHNGTNWILAP